MRMTRRPRTQRASGEGTQGPHEDGRHLPSPTVLSRGGSMRRGAGRIGGAVAALVLFTLALPGVAAAQHTVDITWNETKTYTAETIDVTFTFTLAVSGFTEYDITLLGASVETFPAISQGRVFVVTLRPDRQRDMVRVQVQRTVVEPNLTNHVIVSISLLPPLPPLPPLPAPTGTQREALEALYDATGGESWDHSTNWKDPNQPLSTWDSVGTDAVGL